MIRKHTRFGMMAAALILVSAASVPTYGRIVSSARKVHQSLQQFEASGSSLSMVERLAFSLMLANKGAEPAKNVQETGAPRQDLRGTRPVTISKVIAPRVRVVSAEIPPTTAP